MNITEQSKIRLNVADQASVGLSASVQQSSELSADSQSTLAVDVSSPSSVRLTPSNVQPMPDISIGEVETLEAGEDAYATMTGTVRYPLLNLGIPQGEKGEKGDDYTLTSDDKAEIASQVESDITGVYVPTLSAELPGKTAVVANENGVLQETVQNTTGTLGNTVTRITTIDSTGHNLTLSATKDDVLGAAIDLDADGGIDMFGDIHLTDEDGAYTSGNSSIDGLKTPSSDYQAANKYYVDNALTLKGIPSGTVDNTSTNLEYTATIEGVTAYYDGLAIFLKNGNVTSKAGFTININNLGAKPVYSNMAAATAETTIFNINYTMLFIYDSTRVSGGCWVCYRGYDSNSNTIGYQIRHNSSTLPTADEFIRYRVLFTSADMAHLVPANASTSTSANTAKPVNQRPINPHGPIYYYGSTTAIGAGNDPGATVLWQQYAITLGYSFNRTGKALVLTYPAPVFIVCTPQADGSAIIDPDTPYVQALPSTEDGKIYIYFGIAYSATAVEMSLEHPIYYYANSAIRRWVGP